MATSNAAERSRIALEMRAMRKQIEQEEAASISAASSARQRALSTVISSGIGPVVFHNPRPSAKETQSPSIARQSPVTLPLLSVAPRSVSQDRPQAIMLLSELVGPHGPSVHPPNVPATLGSPLSTYPRAPVASRGSPTRPLLSQGSGSGVPVLNKHVPNTASTERANTRGSSGGMYPAVPHALPGDDVSAYSRRSDALRTSRGVGATPPITPPRYEGRSSTPSSPGAFPTARLHHVLFGEPDRGRVGRLSRSPSPDHTSGPHVHAHGEGEGGEVAHMHMLHMRPEAPQPAHGRSTPPHRPASPGRQRGVRGNGGQVGSGLFIESTPAAQPASPGKPTSSLLPSPTSYHASPAQAQAQIDRLLELELELEVEREKERALSRELEGERERRRAAETAVAQAANTSAAAAASLSASAARQEASRHVVASARDAIAHVESVLGYGPALYAGEGNEEEYEQWLHGAVPRHSDGAVSPLIPPHSNSRLEALRRRKGEEDGARKAAWESARRAREREEQAHARAAEVQDAVQDAVAAVAAASHAPQDRPMGRMGEGAPRAGVARSVPASFPSPGVVPPPGLSPGAGARAWGGKGKEGLGLGTPPSAPGPQLRGKHAPPAVPISPPVSSPANPSANRHHPRRASSHSSGTGGVSMANVVSSPLGGHGGSTTVSNRQRMTSALGTLCLAGPHRSEELRAALEAMKGVPLAVNFLVLLASSDTLTYRGLYVWEPATGTCARIHGHGPGALTGAIRAGAVAAGEASAGAAGDAEAAALDAAASAASHYVDACYKYSTSGRTFVPIPARSVTITTDAVSLRAKSK